MPEIKPIDLVRSSHYVELPDVIVTLRLAKRQAELSHRNVSQALRHCARMMTIRVKEPSILNTLKRTSVSKFPETAITELQDVLDRMLRKLEKEMRGKVITPQDLIDLSKM